jgi:hypothetical protein
MEMILRRLPCFGQGETRLKLVRERMLSRRRYMRSRRSMHLCLCESFRSKFDVWELISIGYCS